MRTLIIISFICFINVCAIAQNGVTATVSNDSILLGNTLTIEFEIKNVKGTFEAPEFDGFRILSGPNTRSSMHSINGKSSSTLSYSYIIEPIEAGELIIEPAYVLNDDESFESDFVKINVYPNPDGIIQETKQVRKEILFDFPFDDFFGKQKETKKQNEKNQPKKKYKLKKI